MSMGRIMNAMSTEMIFLWGVIASYAIIVFLCWRRSRSRKTILDLALSGELPDSSGRSVVNMGSRPSR